MINMLLDEKPGFALEKIKKNKKSQVYFAFIINNKLQASETFEQESTLARIVIWMLPNIK